MIKGIFVTVVVWLMVGPLAAQEGVDIFQRLEVKENGAGRVDLVQDQGIADLVKLHVESNKRNAVIEGFRVQVYSGSGSNSKREAQEAKGMAMSAYPDHKVYLTFTAPFWRVRVGNFRTKSESLAVYHQLKKVFPNCYPVKDQTIKITDL